MAVICDTSGVYALYDQEDRWHSAAHKLVASQREELLLPEVRVPQPSRTSGPLWCWRGSKCVHG